MSAQIKVDPLQFRMMYYSYFYEQKGQRILGCFQTVSTVRKKKASDCTGTSMSCRACFSCLPLSTQMIGYASKSVHLSWLNVQTNICDMLEHAYVLYL